MSKDHSMEGDAFNQIVALLPALTAGQMSKLQERCGAMMQFAGPTDGARDSDAHMLLDCIATRLGQMGLEYSPVAMLRRSPQYSSFAAKVPSIMHYLRQATQNKVELRALASIGIELLYRNLTRMGIPVSARTLMTHVHRLPAVINHAYPGYASAGLLRMVIRRDLKQSA